MCFLRSARLFFLSSETCILSSFFFTSKSIFLDPNDTYFAPLLSTLVALVTTDSVALETGAGNKYNTNRPKGKLNSMQVCLGCEN